MPDNRKIPLNGYGYIGRLALSGGDALSYDDIKLDDDDSDSINKAWDMAEEFGKSLDKFSEAIDKDDKETIQEILFGDEERPLPQVYMPKETYDRIDPELIKQKERECHCVVVPVDDKQMQHIKDTATPYYALPPMPKIPEIVMLDNPHRGKPGGNKTPRIEPKDYRKKKKAKRRAEKQARRRRN